MSTENVGAHLADHVAITDLLNRYTDAGNRGDLEATFATFADDGIWEAQMPDGTTSRMAGIDEIRAGIGGISQEIEFVVQTNHAVVIEVGNDRAWASSTIEERLRFRDGTAQHIIGNYRDELVRGNDGEWRFAHRRFTTLHVEAIAIPGPFPSTAPIPFKAG